MKAKTIKLFATQIPYTQIPYTDEELEENEVYVEFNVEELLDQINNEDIEDYARWSLDMIDPDDCECETINEASEWELVDELKSRDFNFVDELDDDELLDEMESRGLSEYVTISGLDYVDTEMLKEITTLFLNSTLAQRQIMYNLLIK
jgi:hypothetical protein